MTTKAKRNLTDELGPSPNPFFAKKDEPWKNHKLMLKLDGRHEYQYEIAHVLGISESKVSYWMGKAHEYDESQVEEAAEQGETKECVYHEICGNEADYKTTVTILYSDTAMYKHTCRTCGNYFETWTEG